MLQTRTIEDGQGGAAKTRVHIMEADPVIDSLVMCQLGRLLKSSQTVKIFHSGAKVSAKLMMASNMRRQGFM